MTRAFGGRISLGLLVTSVTLLVGPARSDARAQDAAPRPASSESQSDLPSYLKDRGTGVASSMFGTYIRKGELLVYPFFEYYRDRNLEYAPSEFGAAGDADFRGGYRASERLIMFGYGVTDDLALEVEAATIRATFTKAPEDPSALPATLTESGLGDVEAQIRWRWRHETDRRPEFFSYGEIVFPHSKNKTLIGTPGVELKAGTGLTRGFGWGTLTVRGALEYDAASSSKFDVGEYAVEYLKRISRAFRVYAGLEGTADELSLITEAQWHPTRYMFIKINNGRGLTSKATDWSPELGVMFVLPTAGRR